MKNLSLLKQIGDGNNLLIEGDNLKVLQSILPDYEGKVDLIYIDPPYNTGKKMGKYNDAFKSHKDWISFMEPRLRLGKKFLSEGGLIFISIDENEEAYLKVLCNEIFGEKNRLAPIIWQCKYTVSNDKSGLSNQIEHILVYSNDISKIKINNDPLREEYIKSMYKNPDNDPRGLWRGGVQLYKKKNKHSYEVISPNGKKWVMPWNYSEDRWYSKLVKEDIIYWGADGNSCPVKKVFLKDTKGIPIKNLWLGSEVGYTEDGGNTLEEMFGDRNEFLYPKPVSLMKRVLQIASQKNNTILDFFAGSGTMGQAVLEMNRDNAEKRNFILITNNENDILTGTTLPRLEKVISGYNAYAPCPFGLSYLKYEASSILLENMNNVENQI